MYAALISDATWLDEELTQFRMLVVGLIDEGVRVAQVTPDSLDAADLSPFGEHVTWHESRWRLMQRYHLSRLRTRLGKLGVDALHALGSHCWQGAAALARQLDLPVVLTATSAKDVNLAGHLMRHGAPTRMAWIATTEPIGTALRKRLGPAATVEVIAPGVHLGDARAEPREGALCAVITGNGVMDEQYHALLSALPSIVHDFPQTQFFFDGQRQEQHQIWQAAKRFGILSNISLVPRRLGHHEILLGADVLLAPQALGQSRGLTLEAMAQGIAVIAAADPWLDYLVPNVSAWVTERPTSDWWTHELRGLIADRAAGIDLGRSARDWVGRERAAARTITDMLALYRQVSGESIKFEPKPAAR